MQLLYAAATTFLLGLPLRPEDFLAATFLTAFFPLPGGLPRLPVVFFTTVVADLADPGLRPRFAPGLGPRFAPAFLVPALRPRFLGASVATSSKTS